jgi:excisionase family DNA binding protein
MRATDHSGVDAVASRRYLTRADVARVLDVSPATVARWTRQGKLPFVLTLGGHRRYASHEILELIRWLHEPRRSTAPWEDGGPRGARRRDRSRPPTGLGRGTPVAGARPPRGSST